MSPAGKIATGVNPAGTNPDTAATDPGVAEENATPPPAKRENMS